MIATKRPLALSFGFATIVTAITWFVFYSEWSDYFRGSILETLLRLINMPAGLVVMVIAYSSWLFDPVLILTIFVQWTIIAWIFLRFSSKRE